MKMFSQMKDSLQGKQLDGTDEVKVAMKKWVWQCAPEFYSKNIRELGSTMAQMHHLW